MKKYFILIIASVLMLGSCNGDKSNNAVTSGQPGDEGLQSIYIKPQNGQTSSHAIVAGAGFNFKAFATYTSGVTLDVTNVVNWQSSPENIVKVEPNVSESVGVVSVIKPEDVTVSITARIGNVVSNIYKLQVITNTNLDLSVYTLDGMLYPGIASQYNAIAYSSDGYQLLLTNGVNWSVIPTASGSIAPDGIFIPNGSFTSGEINAKFGESVVKNSFKVDTSQISTLEISHNGIPTTLAIGAPLSLQARITYTGSNSQQDITDSSNINWQSSDESILHFTGYSGHFVAKHQGSARVIMNYTNLITAKVESKTLDISVVNNSLESIELAPDFQDLSNYHTLPTDYSFQFNVAVVDQNNTFYPILGAGGLIHWEITAGASIDPITGVVTTGSGDTTGVKVTASLIDNPNIKATYTFNVKNHPINSLEASPVNSHIKVGDSLTYGVLARYVNGNIINVDLPAPSRIKWSIVEGDTKAIIDPMGKLTALAPGVIHVKAQLITNGRLEERVNIVTLTITN